MLISKDGLNVILQVAPLTGKEDSVLRCSQVQLHSLKIYWINNFHTKIFYPSFGFIHNMFQYFSKKARTFTPSVKNVSLLFVFLKIDFFYFLSAVIIKLPSVSKFRKTYKLLKLYKPTHHAYMFLLHIKQPIHFSTSKFFFQNSVHFTVIFKN